MAKKATSTKSGAKTKDSLLETWRELLSPDDIIEVGRRLGVIKRQRKVDLATLVTSTIASVAPVPGAETTAMTTYFQMAPERVAPSSFYGRFTPAYAQLMRELALRAIDKVEEVSARDPSVHDYGVLLEEFDDVRIVDSTCHLVNRLAQTWAPSTSKKRPAGIKIHSVVSLAGNRPVGDVSITPQRRHDNPAAPRQAFEPGVLSLFDMGYLDVKRFIRMTYDGAFFVTRLKDSHEPEIVRVHTGRGRRVLARGMTITEAYGDVLLPQNNRIDLDVRISSGKNAAIVRAVGIVRDDETATHWYLTNVPREVLSVDDVADTYRLRWQIELFFKQLKSGTGLSAVRAWRPHTIQAFVYARIIALCLGRLLELAANERLGQPAAGQLAVLLVLIRALPFYLSLLFREPLTFEEMEERIIGSACTIARSRNQRRRRAKRRREAQIGVSR